MSTAVERYQKLALKESLSIHCRYPIACKELSLILREAFHHFPKNLQSFIFQDTLTAFRLLPLIQTQSAVSAVHCLFQSVEAALPKQKRNIAVTEFKQAMVAHKRRCKAHQVEEGSFQLPQDILVHIFNFLDMQSLVSAGLVCRSWNTAANDNHLWELQYTVLYGSAVKHLLLRLVEDGKDRTVVNWKEAVKGAYSGALCKKLTTNRGYCGHCKSIVWLNNSKCSNVHSGIVPEIQDIKPVTAFQVVEYLVDDSLSISSPSDSDSDSEGGAFSRLWAYPKHIRK